MKLAGGIVRLNLGEDPLMYNHAYVFALSHHGECVLAGKIQTSSLKGEFQYSSEWLDNPASYPPKINVTCIKSNL
jgi:hypothetical protein